MRTPLLIAAALALGLPTAAAAQDTGTAGAPPTPNPDIGMSGDRVTIGIGAATVPDYEGAATNDIIPAAAAVGTLGGFDFFTRGTQLYVDLVKDAAGPGTKFEFGPILSVRFQRNSVKNIDNPQVRALGKIDVADEVGGYAGISRPA